MEIQSERERLVVHLFPSFPHLAETARRLNRDRFFEQYNLATCAGTTKDGARHVLRKVQSEDDAVDLGAYRPSEIVIHGTTSEHTGKALFYMRCDKSKVTVLGG